MDNSPFRVKVVPTIEQIDSDTWTRLVAGEDYFNLAYLQAVERSRLPCRWRYAVAEQDGQVVGASFGYLYRLPLWGRYGVRTFVSGTPLNVGLPIVVAPGIARPPVARALAGALLGAAQAARARLAVFRDLWPGGPLEELGPALEALECRPVFAYRNARLEIRWASFEEYLDAFRSKVRNAIRKDLRTLEERGYEWTLLSGEGASARAEELLSLWEQVNARHHDRDQIPLNVDYFREVTMLTNAVVLGLLRRGSLTGFSLLFAHGRLLEATFCGVDYQAAGSDPVQRASMSAVARYAIEQGFAELDYGISNDTVKSRMGSTFRSLYWFARPVPGALAKLPLERLALRGYQADEPLVRAFHGPRTSRAH
jgi:uncharacterized protein